MACRDLLLKLEQQGQIILPRRKSEAFVRGGNISISEVPHDTTVIASKLKNLLPLRIEAIEPGHPFWSLFKYLLYRYHYLGFNGAQFVLGKGNCWLSVGIDPWSLVH